MWRDRAVLKVIDRIPLTTNACCDEKHYGCSTGSKLAGDVHRFKHMEAQYQLGVGTAARTAVGPPIPPVVVAVMGSV